MEERGKCMVTGQQVKYETEKRIRNISSLPDNAARSALAELRRGAGTQPGELPALWGAFLNDLPEEMFSRNGVASRSEWAIYIALTLFALHQQGKDVKSDNVSKTGKRLGTAVAGLIEDEDDRARVWRRFQSIATAGDIRELSYHLRGMIQLLKAKDIGLDYALLAKDLYDYQDAGRVNEVRLKWGEDFYRQNKEDLKNE